jgi:hypothetical protein
MTANLGTADRMLRLVVASTMFWIVALGLAKGLWAFLPMSIATMMVVTSHDGRCPVYRFLGWSSLGVAKHRSH